MPFQRTKSDLKNHASKDGDGGVIVLTIEYTGATEGMPDTLALVGDAWHSAMFDAGLDPIRGIQDISAVKARLLPGHGAPKGGE